MYLNKAEKQIVVCIAGCKGFADTLLETKPPKLSDRSMRGKLTQIRNASAAILEHMEKGLPDEQVRMLLRYVNNSQIVVLPKANPNAKTDYYMIDQECLDRLLADTIADCAFCDKNDKEVKQCQRRKDLLSCGVIGDCKRDDCPFKEA